MTYPKSGAGPKWSSTLLVVALFVSACAPSAEPPTSVTVSPPTTLTQPPPSTTTTTEPLPPIEVLSYWPNGSSPVEDLVILRGDEHLFDPAAEVTGGVGELAFAWDLDGDSATVESDQMDPAPVLLEPGIHFPTLTVTDEAGQTLTVELPRVVKVGSPSTPSWEIGVAAHVNLSQGLYTDDSEIERALEMIADAGFSAVRVDFGWWALQPQPNQFEWADYDRMVEMISNHGLDIAAILHAVPPWAQVDPTDPNGWATAPRDTSDYGDFVEAVAVRYGDRIGVYSVWNEPNLSLFFQSYDPEKYFPLLQEAFRRIKYVDQDSVVVIGGLSNGPAETNGIPAAEPNDFLRAVYELGGVEYSDAAGLHPYVFPRGGLPALVEKIESARAVMDEYGANDHPLFIDEWAWSTFPPVTEAEVAAWYAEAIPTMLAIDRVGPVIIYNFRDKGTDPNEAEHNYGLITRDWEPKDAFAALQTLMEARQ